MKKRILYSIATILIWNISIEFFQYIRKSRNIIKKGVCISPSSFNYDNNDNYFNYENENNDDDIL